MKTIFITGASSGIGKATAQLFSAGGWHVVATMRNPDNETDLADLPNVTLLALDVTDTAQVEATVATVLVNYDVDVVFNNAGHGLFGAMEAVTDAQMVSLINTNLLGVLRVSKPFIPYFRERGQGLFITTSSLCGLVGFPLCSVYNATKAAVEMWAESMCYEMAAFNVRFKTVSPGGVSTPFGAKLDAAPLTGYEALNDKIMQGFTDGSLIHWSAPRVIAQVVYEAATDGDDKVRYPAGIDAVQAYTDRNQLGFEAHRKAIQNRFV